MRTSIEVEDRKEAALIKRAMEDPEVRAFLKIVGALLPLSDRARKRTLAFTTDSLAEQGLI